MPPPTLSSSCTWLIPGESSSTLAPPPEITDHHPRHSHSAKTTLQHHPPPPNSGTSDSHKAALSLFLWPNHPSSRAHHNGSPLFPSCQCASLFHGPWHRYAWSLPASPPFMLPFPSSLLLPFLHAPSPKYTKEDYQAGLFFLYRNKRFAFLSFCWSILGLHLAMQRVPAVKLPQFMTMTQGTLLRPELPSFAFSVALVVAKPLKLLPAAPKVLLGGHSCTGSGEALKVLCFNPLKLKRGTWRPKGVKPHNELAGGGGMLWGPRPYGQREKTSILPSSK